MAYNYKKSEYGINNNREGIVYKYADGTSVELTYEKITANDPSFTKENFQKMKELSDEIYHEELKFNLRQAYYVKCSLDESNDTDWLSTESLEEEYFGGIRQHKKKNAIWEAINTHLTDVQRKRFLLHALKGLTEREIAELEGVDRRAVHDSINYARKKIQKILKIF